MSLRDLRATAEDAAATLTSAAGELPRLTLGDALPVDSPGRPGELARELQAQLAAAISDRAREAAAHGRRFADAARALDTVVDGYTRTDAEARRRHQDGGA